MPVRPRGCDSHEPELPENIHGILQVFFGVVRVPLLEFRSGHSKVFRVGRRFNIVGSKRGCSGDRLCLMEAGFLMPEKQWFDKDFRTTGTNRVVMAAPLVFAVVGIIGLYIYIYICTLVLSFWVLLLQFSNILAPILRCSVCACVCVCACVQWSEISYGETLTPTAISGLFGLCPFLKKGPGLENYLYGNR